jgi:hypothetical protein
MRENNDTALAYARVLFYLRSSISSPLIIWSVELANQPRFLQALRASANTAAQMIRPNKTPPAQPRQVFHRTLSLRSNSSAGLLSQPISITPRNNSVDPNDMPPFHYPTGSPNQLRSHQSFCSSALVERNHKRLILQNCKYLDFLDFHVR